MRRWLHARFSQIRIYMKAISVYFGLFLLLFASAQGVYAQDNIVKSLEQFEPKQGRVKIHQDPKIFELIGTTLEAGGRSSKINGYRIQVYAGSNSRESRAEAHRMEAKVKQYFGEYKVYTSFNNPSPRWVCRVGDFRSIEEADAAMRRLKKTGVFKEVSIVKEQVIISL